jgi:hypothetical protein
MFIRNLINRSIWGTRQQSTIFVTANMSLQEAVDMAHGSPYFTTIILGEGDHKFDGDYLEISSTMDIEGDQSVAKEDIMITGGIRFQGGIQGVCNLKHLTLRQAITCGVTACSSFTMDDVLVQRCNWHGIHADGTGVVGRCTDVEVRNCVGNGVSVDHGASITLRTSVYGNVPKVHDTGRNFGSLMYGLRVYGSSATIHLVSPLTKEIVSVDNNGDRNWGGTIDQIKNLTKVEDNSAVQAMRSMLARGEVRVPEDCPTLQEAVEWVDREHRLTTIIVGRGNHTIDAVARGYLRIPSAMNIVGDPDVAKEEVVVVGGIWFKKGIQGCHLQHLTLRQAEECGVFGFSSFTMEDVLVEQCHSQGVFVYGTNVVARCTNVEVKECGGSGVTAANGASITLIGARTTVHNNCIKENNNWYGLDVYGSSSTIQLVGLTKEQVSRNNGWDRKDRNWRAVSGGVINQIKKRVRDDEDGGGNGGKTPKRPKILLRFG